ncbi:hypothetical protein LTR08_006581 [Meristemomyces frigidus]|nr:hypothetical protein LTR08_006581 [Meristemomyces frigidus]
MAGRGNNYDAATRTQVVTLKTSTTLTNAQILAITGVQPRQQNNLVKKAKERGWLSAQRLLVKHVEDGFRPGRPVKSDVDADRLLAYVMQSKATRTQSIPQIATGAKVDLSSGSVRRILQSCGFRTLKRKTMPGIDRKRNHARLNTARRRGGSSGETSVVTGVANEG